MGKAKQMVKRIIEQSPFATMLNEWRWQKRHLQAGNDWNSSKHKGEKDEWVKTYWESRNHPHRKLLIQTILNYSPSSVLEVGSNCGPNLYLLAKKLSGARLCGIDINEDSVQKGNDFFAQENMPGIKLFAGKADDLSRFRDNEFDVVFSDAVLIYIGKDKIARVAKELLRVAKRAIVLVEWQPTPDEKDASGLGIYYGGRWKRDYKALFSRFVKKENIHAMKLNSSLWPDPNWQALGYIIEVRI